MNTFSCLSPTDKSMTAFRYGISLPYLLKKDIISAVILIFSSLLSWRVSGNDTARSTPLWKKHLLSLWMTEGFLINIWKCSCASLIFETLGEDTRVLYASLTLSKIGSSHISLGEALHERTYL